VTDSARTPKNILRAEPCAIPDVLLITPARHADSRGHFFEAFSEASFREVGVTCRFVQDNQSLSVARGTLRGLHFQIPPFAQAKLVRVLKGTIFDVAVDIRPTSETFGRFAGATLSAANGQQLFMPAGFAHGFCTLEPDTEVLYKVDAPYSKQHERGLAWNDPRIAVPWPVSAEEVNVLDRDRHLPRLHDLPTYF
jgi:dTDP-4-dehydrorhamnose 3,5-epimerase